jgi:hypothetical protein
MKSKSLAKWRRLINEIIGNKKINRQNNNGREKLSISEKISISGCERNIKMIMKAGGMAA